MAAGVEALIELARCAAEDVVVRVLDAVLADRRVQRQVLELRILELVRRDGADVAEDLAQRGPGRVAALVGAQEADPRVVVAAFQHERHLRVLGAAQGDRRPGVDHISRTLLAVQQRPLVRPPDLALRLPQDVGDPRQLEAARLLGQLPAARHGADRERGHQRAAGGRLIAHRRAVDRPRDGARVDLEHDRRGVLDQRHAVSVDDVAALRRDRDLARVLDVRLGDVVGRAQHLQGPQAEHQDAEQDQRNDAQRRRAQREPCAVGLGLASRLGRLQQHRFGS